jgi:hypothetical protein
MDRDIERRSALVKEIQQATPVPEIITRLKSSGTS